MGRCALAILLATLATTTASAQRVQVGLSRDTIRVGDPFRAVLRIDIPPGTEVVLPDSLTPTEDIENAGRVRTRRDSTAAGVNVVAAYPLTAWRTGPLTITDLKVILKSTSGDRTITVKMPQFNVVSVLPADTTNIQPKPPKDVLGKDRLWWPWLLLAIAIASAIAIAYWFWRKKKNKPVAEEPVAMVLPRDRALQELERIRTLGLAREGMYKRHYTLVSEVLRQYMETVDANWIGGLTTDELSRLTRSSVEVKPAIRVLRSADMVKFAAAPSTTDEAEGDLDRARDWIMSA